MGSVYVLVGPYLMSNQTDSNSDIVIRKALKTLNIGYFIF